MKAVFPSNSDLGLSGSVYGHFGSAPFFVLVDTESSEFQILINQDKDHFHGQCQPLKALGGAVADAVVVGGIGKGALNKLLNAGIKAFRAVEGSVKTNLELLKAGTLPEFSMDETCKEHGIDGSCSH
ncbi:MAG: NifB/NifX family molybdenum-iron cluster-binding protein [Pseudomonadota bacterium]